jgi:hypothetical protein
MNGRSVLGTFGGMFVGGERKTPKQVYAARIPYFLRNIIQESRIYSVWGNKTGDAYNDISEVHRCGRRNGECLCDGAFGAERIGGNRVQWRRLLAYA